MQTRRIRRSLGLVILLLSLGMLAWGLWPSRRLNQSAPITPLDMQLPALSAPPAYALYYFFKSGPQRRQALAGMAALALLLGACSAAPTAAPGVAPPQPTPESLATAVPEAARVPAVPEYRLVSLEWPAAIRAGDSDRIRLTLEIDDQGNLTPTAQVAGNEITGEVIEIPDLYETHQIFAEARLDMAGVEINPAVLVSQQLRKTRSVTFYWSISPNQPGTFRGMVWLYLRFVARDGGEVEQSAIYIKDLEIRAVDLLGLSGASARLLGGIGTVAGSLISLDNLLPWLWKKIRRTQTRPTPARP